MSRSGVPKAYVSWSSGKDAAWALHEARRAGLAEIAGLVTTVKERAGRVAMHNVREALLDAQAASLGLPLVKVRLPWPCPNDIYEARMAEATAALSAQGIRHLVFGDLFLEDIRTYRDAMLTRLGMAAIYPLWKRDTAALARDMIDGGLVAHLVAVDLKKLDSSFAGRRFDAALLAGLPAGIDPCGENGEFHTAVTNGPMFKTPIPVRIGCTVEKDGFAFADMAVS